MLVDLNFVHTLIYEEIVPHRLNKIYICKQKFTLIIWLFYDSNFQTKSISLLGRCKIFLLLEFKSQLI